MKPAPFEYERPDTVAEALQALAIHGERAKVLAGGQSLIPLLNLRVLKTGRLIDIGRLGAEIRQARRRRNPHRRAHDAQCGHERRACAYRLSNHCRGLPPGVTSFSAQSRNDWR